MQRRNLQGMQHPVAAGWRLVRALVPLLLGVRLLVSAHGTAANPRIFDMRPSSGPTVGGTRITFSGADLGGGRPLCRFGDGDLVVEGSFQGQSIHGVVTCLTPAAASSGYELPVELSTSGGAEYTRAGYHFRYYHEAVVSWVSPSTGPAAGGTLLDVRGYNFAPREAVGGRMRPGI